MLKWRVIWKVFGSELTYGRGAGGGGGGGDGGGGDPGLGPRSAKAGRGDGAWSGFAGGEE